MSRTLRRLVAKSCDDFGLSPTTEESFNFHKEAVDKLFAEYKAQENSPGFMKSKYGYFQLTPQQQRVLKGMDYRSD